MSRNWPTRGESESFKFQPCAGLLLWYRHQIALHNSLFNKVIFIFWHNVHFSHEATNKPLSIRKYKKFFYTETFDALTICLVHVSTNSNNISQNWNDPSKQKSNKCSKHAFVFIFAIFSLWEQLKNSNFKPTEGLYTLDIELMISNDGHLSIHVFACCCLLKNVIGFDIWQQNFVSGKNRQLVIANAVQVTIWL